MHRICYLTLSLCLAICHSFALDLTQQRTVKKPQTVLGQKL